MPFHIFPDEFGNNRDHPLSVLPGESTGLKAIGTLPDDAKTFIRIAWIGDGSDPLVFLRADAGSETPIPIDGLFHTVRTSETQSGINAGDAQLKLVDGVYRLQIASNATADWAINFKNDGAEPNALTWVVADSEEDSMQPWVHAVSTAGDAHLEFEAVVGKHVETELEVVNFGTGAATVSGVTPNISSPFTVSGFPAAVSPAASGRAIVIVGFDAPNQPGETTLTQHTLVTTQKTDPGPFGTQHNTTIRLHGRATALPPPPLAPAFDSQHDEFSPTAASPGKLVTLNGFNFDRPGLVVLFDEKPAQVLSKTATTIKCLAPTLPPSSGVFITVKTDEGTAVSTGTIGII